MDISGGRVIGITRSRRGTLVHVEDRILGQTTAVRVIEETARTGRAIEIRLDDLIRWDSEGVLWTPAGAVRRVRGFDYDIAIREPAEKPAPRSGE